MAALRIMFITLAILGIAISKTSATDYIVGDEYGWTLRFDYQAWAKSKTFFVGDTITFQYPVAAHNVLKVLDKKSFQKCVVPIHAEVLGSGNDMIVLKTPGIKWYICGVGKHCDLGMKLAINVWPKTESPAPAPASKGWYY